jgi:hypothetical protein
VSVRSNNTAEGKKTLSFSAFIVFESPLIVRARTPYWVWSQRAWGRPRKRLKRKNWHPFTA